MDTKRFKELRRLARSFADLSIVRFIIRYKRILGIIFIVAFFAFFGYYIAVHPSIITAVLRVGPITSIVILLLYFGVVLTNFVIMYATIRLRSKTLPIKSGFLLTIYSSLVNFFGPLQSGPGVRAVYLKAKIGLRIRDYTYAMLFYYVAFAALNVSLLFINTAWWLTILGIVGAIVLTIIGTRMLRLRSYIKYILLIFFMTLVQIVFMISIYTTELRTVDMAAHFTLLQTISYTASANLSLFVSLTPGGIGIREAFLIFSESLHHVQLSSIVAAGVLDRALYIIFLLILLVIASSMHLKQAFVGKKQA